jgi:hypothetical protein
MSVFPITVVYGRHECPPFPPEELWITRADWLCRGAQHWRYVETASLTEIDAKEKITAVEAHAERDQDAWIEENCPWVGG